MIRPAATICVLRDGSPGMEVLMVRRTTDAAFVGGAHVFPGGAVDAVDHAAAASAGVADAARFAALRELLEEAAVAITNPAATAGQIDSLRRLRGGEVYRRLEDIQLSFDADRLELLSNWVTPPGPPRRFDTRFYVAVVPPGTPATADAVEVYDAEWIRPAAALARAAGGDWQVIFPTRVHLEILARFESAQQALAHAAAATVERIEPRMVRTPAGDMKIHISGREEDVL